MDSDEDHDLFVVKASRRSKDGDDISSDRPGPGGRRREDGTLSAQFHDPKPYVPSDGESEAQTAEDLRRAEEARAEGVKFASDAIQATIWFLWEIGAIPEIGQLVKKKAQPPLQALLRRLKEGRRANSPQSAEVAEQSSSGQDEASQDRSADIATTGPVRTISPEEHQRLMLRAALLAAGLEATLDDLAGVQVSGTDAQPQQITPEALAQVLKTELESGPQAGILVGEEFDALLGLINRSPRAAHLEAIDLTRTEADDDKRD
ncbi:hypothetical protein [Pseudactinotalea sp. Z1748]|uniref:hypothetical protein n=1 Tax=Pseudactinotalea sp. Z1748 TaxID=3413027 RepID=UPI003C7BD71D